MAGPHADHTVILADLDPELHRLPLGIPMGVLGECEEHRRVPLRCGLQMMFSKRSPQGMQQTERLGLARDRRYPRPMSLWLRDDLPAR